MRRVDVEASYSPPYAALCMVAPACSALTMGRAECGPITGKDSLLFFFIMFKFKYYLNLKNV
jgi:hypothetical protein